MKRKQKYPIGIQSFEKLRTEGYEYIDKTELIYNLIDSGSYYFLSRPRRFGKSLLLETMKCIFEGKKHLFSGLYIEDKLEFKTYPIIHISFTNVSFAHENALHEALCKKLREIGDEHEISLSEDNAGDLFEALIKGLRRKYQENVVILIDEYDTPIVHYLPNNIELAEKNRDILKNFYSVVKHLDSYIRFFFLTGITQFSRMSLFSTLNNLSNISTRSKYCTLCGYTEVELQRYFGERIAEIAAQKGLTNAQIWVQIKNWYNGFNFAIENGTTIYNPFSMLSFLQSGEFDNYWFETGTPTFLVKMLRQGFHYQIDNVEMAMSRIKSFELDRIDYGALLYQTGYITIKENIDGNDFFLMGYPNKEVKDSMLQWLLGEYATITHGEADGYVLNLKRHLQLRDFTKIEQFMRSIFANIPSDLFKSSLENFYHAMIVLIFELLGCKMSAESAHAHGRTDAIAETKDAIYLFEFKFNKSANAAIKYIYQQKYYEPHLFKNKEIFLVGVNFTEKARGIAHFKIEAFKLPNNL
ncbi:MAG: AAA family ATPase [Bacteroidia bacterium]